jgi:hypothetical protein
MASSGLRSCDRSFVDQELVHGGGDVGGIEGFRHEPCGPGSEEPFMKRAHCRGREDEDRNRLGVVFGLEGIQEHPAVHDGHHDVQDDGGRLVSPGAAHSAEAIFGHDNLVAGQLQRQAEKVADTFVIVDDQDSCQDVPSGVTAGIGPPKSVRFLMHRTIRSDAEESQPLCPRRISRRMPNSYLVTEPDGTEEITADFYERQGEDWVFFLGGREVYRVPIERVLSVGKTPLNLSSD